MTDRPAQVRRVFHEALDRRPEQRAAYLEAACRDDASLRSEVEALLAALERADSEAFINGFAADDLAIERPAATAARATAAAGRYQLLEELGRGGMGVVLKARDRRLARLVALKFLHAADAADAPTRERFEREARSASAVSHPRLCTIFEVGEDEGRPFLVMELLEGATLAERLRAGPLPLPELIEVAEQMAEGVEAIHAAGIIHRDLKPANVFLTAAGVKILDFGLAKIGAAADVTLDGFQTQPGALLGTIAYMAPEQARGESLDRRADVFSCGAVLYEMATGQAAFGRDTAGLIFDTLLNRDPPRPSSVNPAVPASLERIIARALAKDPAQRYPSMAALGDDLRRLQDGEEAGLPAPAAPRGRRKWTLAAAGAALVALAALAAGLRVRPAAPTDIDSVAVLPFTSVGGDPGGESLAAGVTDSLAGGLARLPGMRVAADSATARYRGATDLAAAARGLEVQAVVTGRVTQQGATLLVSAELTDPSANAPLWNGRYQRRLADIFEVEEEAAQAIADRLRPRRGGPPRPRLVARSTAIPEAYRLYLRGRQEWESRTDEAIRRAIAFYQAAISADPSYPLPHAGLADAYLSFRRGPPLETRPQAKAAAERALALDASLAEAHTSLAMLRFVFDWDWAGAEDGFRRALVLDPRHPTTHHWYGLYLMAMGRSDEARRELERARELDPFSAVISTNLARNEFFAGDDEAAAARLGAALEADRTFFLALGFLSQVRVRQDRTAEAVAAARQASANDDAPDGAAWHGYALARAGQPAAARRIAADLERASRTAHVDGYRVALVYGALGDLDRAFAWLDVAYAKRSPWLAYILKDPAVDALRREARFTTLLQRLGLPPPPPSEDEG